MLFWAAPARSGSPREVDRPFRWLVQPLVRVCARSAVPLDEVRAAMAWWEDHGARFAGPVVGPCAFDAAGTPLDGHGAAPAYDTISIARLGQLAVEGQAGSTRWSAYGGVPLWVVVLLPPGEIGELTLAHELGHALGYPHVAVRGHIMNPREELLGEGIAGLGLSPRSRRGPAAGATGTE
jgi:hypothetical protein